MPRPRKHLRPADYPLIEQWASQGVSEKTIAREVGVAFNTWAAIKQRDPRARDALEQGRAREHDALVGALYKSAVEKSNVVAAIFLLKCRHGYREYEEPVQNQVAVVFQLPGALNPEQYQQVAEITPKKALKEARLGAA